MSKTKKVNFVLLMTLELSCRASFSNLSLILLTTRVTCSAYLYLYYNLSNYACTYMAIIHCSAITGIGRLLFFNPFLSRLIRE